MKSILPNRSSRHNRAPNRRTFGVIAAATGILALLGCERSTDTSGSDQAKEVEIVHGWLNEKPDAFNGEIVLREGTRIREQPFSRSENDTGSKINYDTLHASVKILNPVEYNGSNGTNWYAFIKPGVNLQNQTANPTPESIAKNIGWVDASGLRGQKNENGLPFMEKNRNLSQTDGFNVKPWLRVELNPASGTFVLPGTQTPTAFAEVITPNSKV
ncbi:MAG: hypothetical protein V4702_06430 [Patescibacteria group bacterium]